MSHMRMALSALVLGAVLSSTAAMAQPLGTFRWQLLPYCNVLTLNVSQQGGIYTLDGTDDRCGAGQAASARGLAFLNPNGTIGFGVTMVQPGGVPVHLEAALNNVGSFNGTWRDSTGASGNFVLTTGASIGGPPRGVPSSGVPPGSITAIQLASGAVGTPAIAPNAINGAHVLDGSLTMADISDAPRLSFQNANNLNLSNFADTIIAQVTVTAPAAGRVLVIARGTATFLNLGGAEGLYCSLTTGTGSTVPNAEVEIVEVSDVSLATVPFGAMRVFSVSASSITTFRLVCRGGGLSESGVVALRFPGLTALFIPGS